MADENPQSRVCSDIALNLGNVMARIDQAARGAGRDPRSLTLVAVSKAFGENAIRAALSAGHRVFGENRVQEATAKWPRLREQYPDVELHLVGPLQTNKVPIAVKLFDVIESVDREKLARTLALEMEKSGKRPKCYIQVNTGEEAQKSGVLPADADDLIVCCRGPLGLPVEGLMCIPPADEEPSLHFALLGEIARRNGLKTLSMGMSGDYEIAVQFGATHVRIGTAIFGERPPPHPPNI